MKVLIESILTLVEDEKLQETVSRSSRYAENKVKDDSVVFVLDTGDIFNIAKTEGLEGANKAIDKVLANYGNELKSKLSTMINN